MSRVALSASFLQVGLCGEALKLRTRLASTGTCEGLMRGKLVTVARVAAHFAAPLITAPGYTLPEGEEPLRLIWPSYAMSQRLSRERAHPCASEDMQIPRSRVSVKKIPLEVLLLFPRGLPAHSAQLLCPSLQAQASQYPPYHVA